MPGSRSRRQAIRFTTARIACFCGDRRRHPYHRTGAAQVINGVVWRAVAHTDRCELSAPTAYALPEAIGRESGELHHTWSRA